MQDQPYVAPLSEGSSERKTAKRVQVGEKITQVCGYPESTLRGEVLDARPSPGGGCVLLTFGAGELMLYPTDWVEVA